jgi:hypothetical protein
MIIRLVLRTVPRGATTVCCARFFDDHAHSHHHRLTTSSLQAELLSGEDIAPCPSCSLRIRIVFDPESLEDYIASIQAEG